MIPTDLALPPKFTAFRTGQEDMALDVALDPNRFVMLSAPTGCGKSLVYIAASRIIGGRVLILTSTKGLQQQLLADFAEIGMLDVRGQNNYRCVALNIGGALAEYGKPGTTCDEGPCHVGVNCKLKPEQDGGCDYYDAITDARGADLVITNYAFWMAINKYSDPLALGEFDMIVLDEAHAAMDLLTSFCAVVLYRTEVRSLIGMELPPIEEGVAVWAEWARLASEEARSRYAQTRSSMLILGSNKTALSKKLKQLSDLGRGLSELAKAGEWQRSEQASPNAWMPGAHTDWIAESTKWGQRFSPVWAHAYAEQCLFVGIPKVVLSSATLHRSVGKYLGIDPSDCTFMEFASSFDPDSRPLIYVPTTRVDHRMGIFQKSRWVDRIDEIIGSRRDRKGIIHTRSYARAREIVAGSRHRDIMITHTSSHAARDAVARFKASSPPCVLVSPSMEEGYDFPDDECRYQVLAKVPFVDGRAPLMKARGKTDRDYQHYVTAMSVVQQVGRGCRSDDDWCETFIVDDHWSWFRRSANKLFPGWFRDAWRESSAVPAAPPMEG